MTELQPLLDLLGGRFHRLPQIIAWLGAIQVALKFVNARLQKYLTTKMVEAATDIDSDNDIIWRDVLSARWYRITHFILDLVFRLKLPTLADFEHAIALQKQTARDLALAS